MADLLVFLMQQSIDDLMCECYNLAISLAYSVSERGSLETVNAQPANISDHLWDEIWCWVDGLYQKGFFDRLNGRCSFQESVNFNLAKEEMYMQSFLNRIESSQCCAITKHLSG